MPTPRWYALHIADTTIFLSDMDMDALQLTAMATISERTLRARLHCLASQSTAAAIHAMLDQESGTVQIILVPHPSD